MANGRDTVPIHTPEYQRLRWLAATKKRQAQQVPGPFGGVAEQRYQEIPAPTRRKMSPRQQQETRERFAENERRRAEMLAQQGGVYPPQRQPGFIPRMAKAIWKTPLLAGPQTSGAYMPSEVTRYLGDDAEAGSLTLEKAAKTGMAGAERVARYAWTPVSALGGGMVLDVTRGKSPFLPGIGTGQTQVINNMLRSRLPERRDKRDNDTRPELPDTIQAFVNAIKAIQTEQGLDWDAATHAFQDTYHAPKYYFGAIEAILGLFIPPGAIGPAAGATRGTLALAARASMKATPGIKVAGQTLKWAAEAPAYMGMGMGGVGGPPMPRFGRGDAGARAIEQTRQQAVQAGENLRVQGQKDLDNSRYIGAIKEELADLESAAGRMSEIEETRKWDKIETAILRAFSGRPEITVTLFSKRSLADKLDILTKEQESLYKQGQTKLRRGDEMVEKADTEAIDAAEQLVDPTPTGAIPMPTARVAAVFEPSVKPPKRGMKTPKTLEEAQTQLDEVDGYKTQLEDRLDDMENPDTKAGEALQDRINAAETYYDELESFIDEGAGAIPMPTARVAAERMTFGMGTPASRYQYALEAPSEHPRLDRFLDEGVTDISTDSVDTADAIRLARGNPDASITVYRAVPKGVSKIDPGDWIALDRSYAEMHLRNPSDKIISKKVTANEIAWARTSDDEWLFTPALTKAIPTPTAIAKEPWQMTKAEFNAARVTKQQMLDRGAEGNLNSAVEIQMPISRIEGLEPIPAMEGGYVPGRLITEPVEIRYEKDLDQFILYAGNHRVQQARINGQSTVPAFVEGIKYEDLKQAIPTPTAIAKAITETPRPRKSPKEVSDEVMEEIRSGPGFNTIEELDADTARLRAILARTKRKADRNRIQDEMDGNEALREGYIQVRIDDLVEQQQAASQAVTEAELRLEFFVDHSKMIQRSPITLGRTVDEIERFAAQEGRNPLTPDWFADLDPIEVKRFKAGWFRNVNDVTQGDLKRNIRMAQEELERIEKEIKAFKDQIALEKAPVEQIDAVTLGIEPVARKSFQLSTIERQAIMNTEGAVITSKGISLKAVRFQKPEQAGERSIRGAVFYLPEVKSPYARYYTTGKVGYGGKQRIEQDLLIQNPLIMRGASGGTVPKKAYDSIRGKGAYEDMRTDVLKSVVRQGTRPPLQQVIEILEKYGGDSSLAQDILRYSREGNQLPYAIQENIVASTVKAAGHDAILGYSEVGGKLRLTEVMALGETSYPVPKAVRQEVSGVTSQAVKDEIKGLNTLDVQAARATPGDANLPARSRAGLREAELISVAEAKATRASREAYDRAGGYMEEPISSEAARRTRDEVLRDFQKESGIDVSHLLADETPMDMPTLNTIPGAMPSSRMIKAAERKLNAEVPLPELLADDSVEANLARIAAIKDRNRALLDKSGKKTRKWTPKEHARAQVLSERLARESRRNELLTRLESEGAAARYGKVDEAVEVGAVSTRASHTHVDPLELKPQPQQLRMALTTQPARGFVALSGLPGHSVSSEVVQYQGRKIVIVAMPDGRKQGFYRRIGSGGYAKEAPEGTWVPFDGTVDDMAGAVRGWINKSAYTEIKDPDNPLHRFGSEEYKRISAEIKKIEGALSEPQVVNSRLAVNKWLGVEDGIANQGPGRALGPPDTAGGSSGNGPPPRKYNIAEGELPDGSQMDLDLAKAIIEVDRPGAVSRMLDKLPPLKWIRRKERPGLDITDHVLEAHVGEKNVISRILTAAFSSRYGKGGVITEGKRLFGGKKGIRGEKRLDIEFTGTAEQEKYPWTGYLFDIFQNPHLYRLSDEQAAYLIKVNRDHNDYFLARINEEYGAGMPRYPVPKGAVFLPNIDMSEGALSLAKQSGKKATEALARGRTQPRFYETARERWMANPDFVPELNIEKLLAGLDSSKAHAAGSEFFVQVVGGRTRLEVIKMQHPALVKAVDLLQKRLMSVRGKLARTEENISSALNDFNISAMEAEDMLKLQEVLDLELTRGVHAMDIPGMKVAVREARNALVSANKKLKNVQIKGWELVGLGINRYFRVTEARQIRELREISDNTFIKWMEEWRQTAFNGDTSPLTGVQIPIGLLSDPFGLGMQIARGIGKMVKELDPMMAFSKTSLVDDIRNTPATIYQMSWEEFAAGGGRSVGGATTEEFAGGLLRFIPGYNQFNEGMFTAVIRAQKGLADRIMRDLIVDEGLSRADAIALAMDHATKAYPMINPTRLGQSRALASQLRATFTSVSFVRKPTELMADAHIGFVKMLIPGLKPTLKEKLAVKRIMHLYTSVFALSLTSQIMDAQRRGKDIPNTIREALDPTSGKFMSVVWTWDLDRWDNPQGKTRSMPLGGPYRSLIKALWPRMTKVPGTEAEVPVPFVGLLTWLEGKIGPGISTTLDLIKNEDWAGNPIRGEEVKGFSIGDKGFITDYLRGKNTPEGAVQMLQSLAYAFEGGLPLLLGEGMKGWRTNMDFGETAEEMSGQALGNTVRRESVFQQRDALAQRFAREKNFKNYVGDDILQYRDMSDSQKQMFDKAYPDIQPEVDKERERRALLGDESAERITRLNQIKADMKASQLHDDRSLELGLLGDDLAENSRTWRQNRKERMKDLYSRRDEIYLDVDFDEPTDPLGFYYAKIEEIKKKQPNGILSDDAWDLVDLWLSQQSRQDQEYIHKEGAIGDFTKTERDYLDAIELLREYWEVPEGRSQTARRRKLRTDNLEVDKALVKWYGLKGIWKDAKEMKYAIERGYKRQPTQTNLLNTMTQRAQPTAPTPTPDQAPISEERLLELMAAGRK